jgi:hypothetical protein
VTSTPPQPATGDDVERLRAEKDELERRLEAAERPRRHRVRRIATPILVVLTALVVAVGSTGLWLRANTLKTNRFVELVGPLGADADVQTALADFTSKQLERAVDVRSFIADALPPRAQVLAVPLSAAVNGYISDRVDTFFTSGRFQELWQTAVRRAHEGILKVLAGDAENVTVENGDVVLNLVPLYNAILQRIADQAGGLLGRDVNLPEITPGMLPDEARDRIETAIGRPLPSDWGTIVVFESDKLTAMQDAVQLFKRATIALALLAIVLIAGTILVSVRKRRTVLQLALAIAAIFVLLRRITFAAQDQVLAAVKVEENERAVKNITDHVLSGYFGLTAVILWVCAGVALVAFLAGPSRVAVAVRSGAVSLARTTAGAATRAGGQATSSAWVLDHREALQVGIAVVGALFVLVANVTFWQLVIVVIIVGALEVVLFRIGPRDVQTPPPGDVGVS